MIKLIKLIGEPDLALDLGNANTRLYALGRGIICDGPSVPESNHNNGHTVENGRGHAVSGDTSVDLCARSVTPLTGGVVTDIVGAAKLLTPFFRRARSYGLRKPRVLACAPTDATRDEVKALVSAVERAGGASVKVVGEPLAAAVGAGLDISIPYAQMLIDIGDGVTDIAVIRSGVLVKTAAVRSACRHIYAMIQSLVARRYGVMLYWREAERLAMEIGWAHDAAHASLVTKAVGLGQAKGHELEVAVSSADVSEAIQRATREIREMLRVLFRSLADDVAAEVIESGVCLTGGGAYLPGMKEMIAEETWLDVRVADDPLRAVIYGAGKMLAVGAETGSWRS